MKKLLIGAVSAVALSFAFTGPASADPSFSKFCSDNNDFGYTHGECTSILTGFYNKGKGNNDAAAVCRDFRAGSPAFFDAAWGNLGKCVKFWAPLLPG